MKQEDSPSKGQEDSTSSSFDERNAIAPFVAIQMEQEAVMPQVNNRCDSTSTRVRHVGRAARQRRRKWKEIRHLEESLRVGKIVLPEVLPGDRDLVSPSVLRLRASAQWNSLADDGMALQSQLGYIPGNAIRVVARVKDVAPLLSNDESLLHDANTPVVIQLYPLVWRDDTKSKSRKRSLSPSATAAIRSQQPIVEPFPTLYWLTHPLLRCLVSKLELEGWGLELEQRLQQDAVAMDLMRQAHVAYGQERWSLLSVQDQEPRWEAAVAPQRGVAGIRNFGAVKCLHAHFAHFLSQGPGSAQNRVGQWVWDELMKQYNNKR